MPRDKVDVVKRAVDAYNRRDLKVFAGLMTPDFEFYAGTVTALGGDEYRGREGVERFAADTRESWEELQNVAEEFRDLGDRVLMLGRFVGRGKGSGAPIDVPMAGLYDLRGDRIRRYRGYLDRAEAFRAAGVSE